MRIISFSELKPRKGIRWTRVHIGRKVAAGEFPQPVELGGQTIGWVESEIDRWLADRAAERENKHAAA